MSSFLNSLSDRLEAMEQEMQTFPAELDSIITRVDRRKWRSLLIHLNHDLDKQLDELFVPEKNMAWLSPIVLTFAYPYIRHITDEDLSRWRAAHKPEVRVIVGNGKLEVTSASRLAALITPVAQQQGYVLLNWDQYQKLLNEISKLINGDD